MKTAKKPKKVKSGLPKMVGGTKKKIGSLADKVFKS